MTGSFVWLLAMAGVVACLDWWAVASSRRRLECVLKPLVMAVLMAAAAVLDASPMRSWFLGALFLSLAGDVFLLFGDRGFLGGLAAFLVAHVLYVVGLSTAGFDSVWLMAGSTVAITAGLVLGPRIVRGAGLRHRVLPIPVALYLLTLSAMVGVAFGTGSAVAAFGALAFLASDAVLGWNAFVRPLSHARLLIMTTYHLAQIALVASLTG